VNRVLLDTGPLVAALDQSDNDHIWARGQFKSIQTPLLTCEAVIAEACFLLRSYPLAIAAIGRWIDEGIIETQALIANENRPIFMLMKKFSSVPMSLADACLVRLSELNPDHRLFSLDKDFLIYRRNGRQRIPVLMPKR
jgi:uncharacterized protein